MTLEHKPLAAEGSLLSAALAAAQGRYHLFPTADAGGPTPVVVGVSGGVDSICLLHALLNLAGAWQLTLHVAHLDHALRLDSAADAAFVAQVASEWGLAFHAERLASDLLASGGSEAMARQARYAFLARIAINVTPPGKVPIVAVAHHADDQAETVLLHLVRGSGLQGLGAMRWVTRVPGVRERVRLVRPLLAVHRETVLAYAKAHRLAWREDSTNTELRFARNRVRHELLPLLTQLNPNIVTTLGRSAASLAADAERLNELDKETLEKLSCEGTCAGERFILDLDRWLALDAGCRRGVIRRALVRLAPVSLEIGFHHVEQLVEQIEQRPTAGGPHPIAGDLCWSVAGARGDEPARLSIHAASALPFAPAHPFLDGAWRAGVGSLLLPNGDLVDTPGGWRLTVKRMAIHDLPEEWRTTRQPWMAYFDAGQMGRAALTTPRPGMRIGPLGMGGKGKTVGDLFTDAKIPLALRAGWPLIVDQRDATVLWVCGLALAERVRITGRTTSVVALAWQRLVGTPCAAQSSGSSGAG